MSSPTTPPPSHQLECTPQEVSATLCLNGGKCYAWEAGGVRDAACSCPADWTGARCEEMYIDPGLWPVISSAEIAGLAVGVAVAGVIFITIIVFTILWCRRRRRRQAERPMLESSNCASVNMVDGRNFALVNKPLNGRVNDSSLASGNISQQTMSSLAAAMQDSVLNNNVPSKMMFETQV